MPTTQETILVVSPADLQQGFQFVANYSGGTFLVTGEPSNNVSDLDGHKMCQKILFRHLFLLILTFAAASLVASMYV